MQSAGGTVSVLSAHVKIPGANPLWGSPYAEEYNFAMVQTGATYFPRLNFLETQNSSLSIGMPISLGFGSASNTSDDSKGVFFSYDLPVIADYNIGLRSTSENEKNFGFFFGAGFGYNHVGLALSSGSEKISSYGPLAHTGARFNMNRTALTLGFFYKMGMETQKYKTFGFQVLADL